MKLPFGEFIKFVELAFEKEQESKIHRQWCAMLPFMSLGMLKYEPFNEYLDSLTGKNIDFRPKEVIIAEIRNAQKELEKKGV